MEPEEPLDTTGNNLTIHLPGIFRINQGIDLYTAEHGTAGNRIAELLPERFRDTAISIHSPIAEADSKYTYIFHILLIFFIKLYHIPLLYTSHPPIDSHFHQNIN